MKHALQILILTLFTFHARGQYLTVTNLSGTSVYGTTSVTVTSSGSASTIPYCGVNPYWIGAGSGGTIPLPGSYTFAFSPAATAVRLYVTAMDVNRLSTTDTEKIAIAINGIPYTLTAANFTVYPGTCAQPAAAIMSGLLVCVIDLGAGAGGQLDVAAPTINSCVVSTNGLDNGSTFTFQFIEGTGATNNGPVCVGDTLKLGRPGDSTAATYYWYGPGGFTSTLQNPFIFPAILADSGTYYVVRTIAGVHDTAHTLVVIKPNPLLTVSSNSPMCQGLGNTLMLFASPDSTGETFSWSGPAGFSSTLENPTVTGFADIDTGYYTVVATWNGCRSKDSVHVILAPIPPAPVISGVTTYCTGQVFVPFTVTATGTVLWYTTGTGGAGSTVPIAVSTAVPGTTIIWVSQKVLGCESARDSIAVTVRLTPAAPTVTGVMDYCQYKGPIVPLTVTPAPGNVLRWYTTATGGSFSLTEPLPNINIAGANNYWVSEYSGYCESARTPVTITVHPKPSVPVINPPHRVCQSQPAVAMSATPSGSGDVLTWYGPGFTVGYPIAPMPPTDSSGTIRYFVTETSSFGCVSDSVSDEIEVVPKPQPPIVRDVSYCQYFHPAAYLNAQVDSQASSYLKWYFNTTSLTTTPLPVTDTVPGNTTWLVGQVINGCESDKKAITVTIIYKPVFEIAARPWVCQFDSIMLSYSGQNLFAPGYMWTIPTGAHFANYTHEYDSSIVVRFDSAILNNYVHLTASDDSGKCKTDTSIRIKIIRQPDMNPHCPSDICLGDTVILGLANETAEAYTFTWRIDSVLLKNSSALNVVASNSNSGGPFSISWIDSGRHIIAIESFSKEGCRSEAAYDTINVRTLPDATFKISPKANKICLEDSVLFIANSQDYNNSYGWGPTHYFNNINTPVIWGKAEDARSIVTLTVTDPYGCAATESMEIDPEYCCTIWFPTAFSPNGDGKNDLFHPVCSGYHRLHMLRIVNRWGQTVYESENTNAAWNGNYNGVPQDIGTYYYYLKYDCGGNTLEQKGDVTLIR